MGTALDALVVFSFYRAVRAAVSKRAIHFLLVAELHLLAQKTSNYTHVLWEVDPSHLKS